jgi:hypothetical protein
MPNEQTSVPLFASGEVLTAQNLNLSAGTGVPVFATTVTRDAAFGGTSEKVLAEGQLCYLSDSNIVQYYTGAAWATVGPATSGALVRVGGGTLSTSTTTFSNVFSSAYNTYLIQGNDITVSASATMRLSISGSGGTTYSSNTINMTYTSATVTGDTYNGSGNFVIGTPQTTNTGFEMVLVSPFLSKATQAFNRMSTNTNCWQSYGVDTNAASSVSCTILMPGAQTFSSGPINIYGYANS